MSLLPNLSALATGQGGQSDPQRRGQKNKVVFKPQPNPNPEREACQYKVCGDALSIEWSLKLEEIYSAEMLVRYQTPLPDPFAKENFYNRGYVPEQWERYPYRSASKPEWENHWEFAHPRSFRTLLAKQNLIQTSDVSDTGSAVPWEAQSDYTKHALGCTLWREEPVYMGDPKAVPAGNVARCPPKYCLMPMTKWVERAAKLTEEERANDRLFRLMDGYCHLMTWAYRLHDSAAATPDSKLRKWYNEAGRAIRLLQSYLPVMRASVAQIAEKPDLENDGPEQLLVKTYSDCKFSKTDDERLPSELIKWLMAARNDLDKHFEAQKQGHGDQDAEEKDDEEAEENALENQAYFWQPPPPLFVKPKKSSR